MDTKGLLDHTIISTLGSLLGIFLGWITGSALVAIWQKCNLYAQKIDRVLVFLPWRTFICGLLLLNYFPIFVIWQVGLGKVTGIISVAFVVFWLTLIVVCQSTQANIVGPVISFVSWARTWSVFSVLLTAHYGIWGGGGLGFTAKEQLFVMHHTTAWSYFWWMAGIALGIDLAIAVGQVLIYQYVTPKHAG